ncbi:hypothetical protein OGATHE_000039 [Ogataea polymorpha]|uniref:Uncharacterized protein n=1 Tax=Ogataea polymorpha TaxID=460523 RepID=A0A9P8THF1_9ASCO|nr:hypothetical protein OGATHE_000039 [Ogataea polymorpha]
MSFLDCWISLSITAFGTMSATVRLTMLKYECISNFITSVSWVSLSVIWPVAFSTLGGASMAASRFLFLDEKKPPKNDEDLFSSSLTDEAECAGAGSGFPVFGSTWTGVGCNFSWTMASA